MAFPNELDDSHLQVQVRHATIPIPRDAQPDPHPLVNQNRYYDDNPPHNANAQGARDPGQARTASVSAPSSDSSPVHPSQQVHAQRQHRAHLPKIPMTQPLNHRFLISLPVRATPSDANLHLPNAPRAFTHVRPIVPTLPDLSNLSMEEIVERHAELVGAYPPPEPKDYIFEKDEPGVQELIDAYYEIENGPTPSEPELPVSRRRLYAWSMSTVQQSQLVSAYHEYFPVRLSTSYESAQRSELHVQGSEDSSSGNSDMEGLRLTTHRPSTLEAGAKPKLANCVGIISSARMIMRIMW